MKFMSIAAKETLITVVYKNFNCIRQQTRRMREKMVTQTLIHIK